MNNRKSLRNTCYLLLFTYCLAGCASMPPQGNKSPSTQNIHSIYSAAQIKPTLTPTNTASAGVYHKIKKGQTLWQISKIYNVDLDSIITANNINDTTQLQTAQTIFIPGARGKPQRTTNFSSRSNADNFIWPARGKIIAKFGQSQENIKNNGIDLQLGQNPEIVAAAGGKIAFAAPKLQGYGKTIIIEHPNNFMTVYAYLSEILVSPGQYIEQGALIAKANSSIKERKNILHFEIRKGYNPQNPQYYLI